MSEEANIMYCSSFIVTCPIKKGKSFYMFVCVNLCTIGATLFYESMAHQCKRTLHLRFILCTFSTMCCTLSRRLFLMYESYWCVSVWFNTQAFMFLRCIRLITFLWYLMTLKLIGARILYYSTLLIQLISHPLPLHRIRLKIDLFQNSLFSPSIYPTA